MSTLSAHTANAIRAELARRRITHAELAKHLGCSPAALSRRLSGAQQLHLDELHRIAEFLDMDATAFLPAGARTTGAEGVTR